MIKASDLFEKYKYKKVQHEDGSFGYIVGYDAEFDKTDYTSYESYPLIATKHDGWTIKISTDIIVSELEMALKGIIKQDELVKYDYISVDHADRVIANNISIDINNRIN